MARTVGRWMSEHSTSELGVVRGKPYYLTVRATPNFDRVRDFAVVLYYTPADDPETKIQIARIDTTHGYTHFDRLYRRDQPKERIDVDIWQASTLLEDNWRTYAERYDDLHR